MGLGKLSLRFMLVILSFVIFWQITKRGIFYADDTNESQVNQDENGPINAKMNDAIEKVIIAVYYEALCPDSRGFIINQLVPTYQKIPDNVVIELIPYGKATTTELPNGYKFTCQHGPRECEANMIHACAIDMIKNPDVQVNFIACMIDHNFWPINITRTCAEKMHLDADHILNCTKGSKGPELLAKYGKMSQSLRLQNGFIPTITLNGDSDDQAGVLANLLSKVCKLFKVLPSGC